MFWTTIIPVLVVTLTVNGLGPETAPFPFEIAPVVAFIVKPTVASTIAYDTDVTSEPLAEVSVYDTVAITPCSKIPALT